MFGRKKITTTELAGIIANIVLAPLVRPEPQNDMFRQQAVAAGAEPNRFAFEAVALQCYAFSTAIARERSEGRITGEIGEQLVKQFMGSVHEHIVARNGVRLAEVDLNPDDALELIMERGTKYVLWSYGQGDIHDIQKYFAEFCGVPGSDVVERIGWSLFLIRANAHGDWLKTWHIVKSE
jgi:hypothetical protein